MTTSPDELKPCRCGATHSQTIRILESFSFRYRVAVIDCSECGHAAAFTHHYDGDLHEKARKAWNATLTQEHTPQGINDGFRVVPVDPTEKMLVEACAEDWLNWDQRMPAKHYAALYKAMLSAAPTPPPAQQQGGGDAADLAILVKRLIRALKKYDQTHPLIDTAIDYLCRRDMQGSPLREAQPSPSVEVGDAPTRFECAARKQGTAGGNDPAECDWPMCGCDPYADKVIAALQESGIELRREADPVPRVSTQSRGPGDTGQSKPEAELVEALRLSKQAIDKLLPFVPPRPELLGYVAKEYDAVEKALSQARKAICPSCEKEAEIESHVYYRCLSCSDEFENTRGYPPPTKPEASTQPLPADNWQPIETAPKEVPLLLYAPPENLYIDTTGMSGEYRVAPTRNWTWASHWQPLPEPPSDQKHTPTGRGE